MSIDFAKLNIELSPEQATAVQEALKTVIDSEVGGLKAKRDELLGNQAKLKEQLQQFEGIDPVKVRELEAEKQRLEEERLIAEGKHQEVLEMRIAQRDSEWAAKYNPLVEANERNRAKAFDSEIQTAAAAAGVPATSQTDVMLRAKSVFKKSEDGQYRPLDDNGNVIMSDKGTPLTLLEFTEGLRQTAPHLFGVTQGAGTIGDTGRSATGKQIDRAGFNAMNAGQRAEFMRKGGKVI